MQGQWAASGGVPVTEDACAQLKRQLLGTLQKGFC